MIWRNLCPKYQRAMALTVLMFLFQKWSNLTNILSVSRLYGQRSVWLQKDIILILVVYFFNIVVRLVLCEILWKSNDYDITLTVWFLCGTVHKKPDTRRKLSYGNDTFSYNILTVEVVFIEVILIVENGCR